MAIRGGKARRDFGAVRRFGLGHAIVAAVMVTAATGVLTFEAVKARKASVALAKVWDIQGPPCPSFSAAEFTARHYIAPKTFPYDDVTIGRTAGDASCSDVMENAGKGFGADKVCQFTSPATLTVASSAGAFYFVPGAGQPATLHIHKGVPTCVMASKFTLKSE